VRVFVGLYFYGLLKIKIALNRCHILRLKCTEIDFFWGSAPDPVGIAYSASPDPLAGFKEPYILLLEGRVREERKGGMEETG